MTPDNKTPGTIKEGEYRPAADSAMAFIKSLEPERTLQWQETFASLSLAGNRLAEICSETLQRLLRGEPVSDRYLLGLAWTIRSMEDGHG